MKNKDNKKNKDEKVLPNYDSRGSNAIHHGDSDGVWFTLLSDDKYLTNCVSRFCSCSSVDALEDLCCFVVPLLNVVTWWLHALGFIQVMENAAPRS